MRVLFVLLFVITGCKEFYDEDFEKFDEETRTTSTVTANDVRNTNYNATLKSTDSTIPKMQGTANIYVNKGIVKVDVRMNGIPANIIQLHYSFVTTRCNNLAYTLPADTSKKNLRSYTIFEEISTNSLAQDLASSGASTTRGDINLGGKTLVVKAFYNFSGIPTTSGTNQLTIACGEVKVSRNNNNSVNLDNPDEDL